MPKFLVPALLAAATAAASAEPLTYDIDPHHTYPSFEADHMGISVWRGKMTESAGTIVYDKASGEGKVKVTVDTDSISFGHRLLEQWAKGALFFDSKKYSKAVFEGRFANATAGVPTELRGELTLHGVTRPLTLSIKSLKCVEHPMLKRDLCGADAYGSFQRDEFGLDAGKDYGFRMAVDLRIQVEAIARP